MKTNNVMIREKEAWMQRTKDAYFNATKLLEYWNNSNNEKKVLGNFNKLQSTKEFILQLEKEGINKPLITGRGSGVNSGTWMHPKLFIDFAMWISVEFKSKVIDYVLDGLIKMRNDAGDYYNEMCAQILDTYIEVYNKKPHPLIYINEANLIKSLVTDKHRNEMTEQELRQITYLQKVNANLIKKAIGKQSRIKKLTEASEILI